MEQQLNFKVMEWHRGELAPIMTTDKGKPRKPKVVKITQTSADELNQDFSKLRGLGIKIKYILSKDQPVQEIKKEFNYKVANRTQLVYHCKTNEIDYGLNDTVKVLRGKIKIHRK